MVPLGHCNWFWRRLLYNYWTESSSNGNSISKGKSAAISKIFLEQLCFSFKTITVYHAAQSRQFWTSPKDVKHTNCYFCNSTVQFLDVSCKRKCHSFQDKLQPVSSMSLEQNCFFLKGVLPCHWPWHILKTILNLECSWHSANCVWIGYFKNE